MPPSDRHSGFGRVLAGGVRLLGRQRGVPGHAAPPAVRASSPPDRGATTSTRIEVISGREIDAQLRSRWRLLQRSNPSLASPYFCVEFTEAVAQVRSDVYVAVIEVGNRIIGLFPFHRRRFGFGRPVGLGLSDYHGVIAEPNSDWTADQVVEGSGLARWEFDHLPATQEQFNRFMTRIEPSPIIDVSGGMAAYAQRRAAMGDAELRNIRRRDGRLQRDHGCWEFRQQDRRESSVQQLLALKSAQYRECGTYDCFKPTWVRDLIAILLATRTDDFGGLLSTVCVDGKPIALHFGMRSSATWHWWFPCYEPAFSRYSPGLILLLEVVRCAAEGGMQCVDLGKGLQRYKRNLMTDSVLVAAGAVQRPLARNRLIESMRHVERQRKASALAWAYRLRAGVIRRVNSHFRFN